MKSILLILNLLFFTDIFGQQKDLYNEILFSTTGDTILKCAGVHTDTNDISTITWRVITRNQSLDSLISLATLQTTSKDSLFSLDAIPSDTIAKYNLMEKGHKINYKNHNDFKILIREKIVKSKKHSTYSHTKVISCKVDCEIYLRNQVIFKFTDFPTMYYSENKSKIDKDDLIKLAVWKMEEGTKYLIAISYCETIIKDIKNNNAMDKWFYYKWILE